MAKQLKRTGCTVHVANHGLEALEFLNTTSWHTWNGKSDDSTISKGVTLVDVVLLDWEMPVMDGLTCISRIRALEAAGEIVHHIPVIAVTANARSEQIQDMKDRGADEVVTKPFRIRDLVPVMQSLANRYPGPG